MTKVCCRVGRLTRCFCRDGMRKHCEASEYAMAVYVAMLFFIMHSQMAQALHAVRISRRISVAVV